MLLQGLLGLIVIIGTAWLMSEDRRAIPWRPVLGGLVLQFALATLLLKAPLFYAVFSQLHDILLSLIEATRAGTSFVFGFLGGGPFPFEATHPSASFVLAFQALPLILVMSALSALLFYWRILPLVVRGFALLLQKTLGISGATGLSAAANVLLGMVEAPLLVRPYLERLTRGELFMLMSCGMATIAGTVMVLYASILVEVIPGAMGHLLSASVISAPGAIVIAALMVPPGTEDPNGNPVTIELPASSSMDAITLGTLQGINLVLNVAAMLIVLIALVSLANQSLALLPPIGDAPITLQRILGWAMAPLAWLLGIPWLEAATAGSLMGTKLVLNELIAYIELAQLSQEALSDRSRLIMVYAMCGFANLGSLGILIGGLGSMIPARRKEIVSLGLKAVLAGTLATGLTALIVGLYHL
ncbi:MAG: NupC/NupG family nucleoside CNT transporter [Gammaproteobacteria bacterium]